MSLESMSRYCLSSSEKVSLPRHTNLPLPSPLCIQFLNRLLMTWNALSGTRAGATDYSNVSLVNSENLSTNCLLTLVLSARICLRQSQTNMPVFLLHGPSPRCQLSQQRRSRCRKYPHSPLTSLRQCKIRHTRHRGVWMRTQHRRLHLRHRLQSKNDFAEKGSIGNGNLTSRWSSSF